MIDRGPENSPQTHARTGGDVLQARDIRKANTMKAIVGDTCGPPDVLELRDID